MFPNYQVLIFVICCLAQSCILNFIAKHILFGFSNINSLQVFHRGCFLKAYLTNFETHNLARELRRFPVGWMTEVYI
jgi:hypothetical protein